jgi:hypothetical protein
VPHHAWLQKKPKQNYFKRNEPFEILNAEKVQVPRRCWSSDADA